MAVLIKKQSPVVSPVKEWKKKSLEAMTAFKKSLNDFDKAYDYKGLITYEEICQIPMADGTPLEGANGAEIFSPKIHADEHHQIFLTVLLPQDEFNSQWHNCLERCDIITGELADKLTKDHAKKGESLFYKKGTKHIPYNPSKTEPCKLIVTFFKP